MREIISDHRYGDRRQQDERARGDREPGFGAERRLRLIEHVAPAGGRRTDADAEETERRLEEDAARDRERHRHGDRRRRVWQEMANEHAAVARTRRSRALDEAGSTERSEFRAHDARSLHPAGEADEHDQPGNRW